MGKGASIRDVARNRALFLIFMAAFFLLSCQSTGGGGEKAVSNLAKDYSALGDEYFALSKYEKAEAAYRKALELDPSLTIGSYQLARSYAETGQLDKSIKLIDFLLQKEPTNSLFLSLKAYALLLSGKPKEARIVYEKLSDSIPYSQDVIYNGAVMDFAEGSYQDAIDKLELLLSQKADDLDVVFLLARSRLLAGEEAEGRLLLKDYLAAKPNDPSALRLLARSYVRSQEYTVALEAWESLQASPAADAEVWIESAKIYALAAEDDEKGIPALKKALDAGWDDQEEIKAFLDAIPEDRREAYRGVKAEEQPATPE